MLFRSWFDPASGMGNFPIAVYLRLIDSLSIVIPNKKERKRHILENMLYMSELNSKNVLVCKNIFDIENQFNLNIYCGDTLQADFNQEFGVEKFDIIVGNPPYQDSKATGDNKLYLDFTKDSIDKIKDNGLLLFITPRNILEYLLLVEKNRKYINTFYQINHISIETDRKSTRLNSSHVSESRMPSSA